MNDLHKMMIAPFIVCCIFIACILVYNNKVNEYEKQIIELKSEIEEYKKAANPSKETIDSLVYNIEYRDSIIYYKKVKYVEDVEIIKNMPDSAIVDKFKELVWSE